MKKPYQELLKKLKAQLKPGELILDEKIRKEYSTDKWLMSVVPDAVALPTTDVSVSKILAFANKHGIPVTPRGAGCGYAGGCVPVRAGIVLSVERFNKIKEINVGDFVAITGAGVVTEKLQKAVEHRGLFYPPDPASLADSFIGGNIATNAGGPRCLKYGVTRDYVLGLKVVLADGTILSLGSRTHKNKTGFDLSRIFVGSEGLLGVITEAVLKLIPLPPFRACLSIGFESMEAAARTIRNIFASGILPSAVEIADEFTLASAQKYTGSKLLSGCKAHLLLEQDGQEKAVRLDIIKLEEIARHEKPVFVKKAFGKSNCEIIWNLRRVFSTALKSSGLKKINEDVTVPRSKLEDLFALTAKLQNKYGFPIACFGHAGDGNIHVNIMVDESDPDCQKQIKELLDNLFSKVLAFGGVITGEHGIGLARLPWWNIATSPEVRDLHRRIKSALDPKGILNPGKFV
jgi:glycolate oxidase